jgi:Zn-dependent peptidase ImmA (M78 family)
VRSFFLDNVSRLRCGWNRKPLTEDDFFALCLRKKITVVEMPLETNGFYYCVKGRHFIAVDSRLEPYKKLLVMFHEFAHYLMHAPDSGVTANFHGIGRKTRKESEADAFALCALMPEKWISEGTIYRIADEDGIPPWMVIERLQVHKNMGF